MSMNLHLKATVQSTLHLKSGDVRRKTVEHFDLVQTPTKVTNEALESANTLEFYLKWLRQNDPEESEVWYKIELTHYDDPWVEEGETITDYVTPEDYELNYSNRPILEVIHEPTMRMKHEQELMEWLKEHQGWDIEWYDM